MPAKKKFFLTTTVPITLRFFKGQIQVLKELYDIELLSSFTPELAELASQEQVPYRTVAFEREISLQKDFRSLLDLIKLFRQVKPYVVHGNTPKGGLLSMLAAFITSVPVRIYCVHGLRYQGSTGFKGFILKNMERFSCLLANHVITVGFGMQATLKKDKITSKPVTVIGNGSVNGISADRFDPETYDKTALRNAQGIDGNSFIYGFVGRLVGDKGINELVEAFTEIAKHDKNAKLLLVGDYESSLDPLKQSTIAQLDTNDQIICVGFQSDIRPFFAMMDVFTFPSYREGLSVSLIEAGAMGLPLIISDVPGCNEIVEQGVNGIKVEPKNSNALAKAMTTLKEDRSLRNKMIVNSRKMILERYEQEFFWKEAAKYYSQFLELN